MIVLLGIVLTWQMRVTMRHTLAGELEQRGISIANRLADRALDQMMTGTVQDLYELMWDTAESNQDVRYAFLLDSGGNILAHSFDQGYFDNLPEDTNIPLFQTYRTDIFFTEEELINDVGVVLFGGVGTVHVGMSHHGLERIMAAVTQQFVLITLAVSLFGVVISLALTWAIARPLVALADATKRLPQEELEYEAEPWLNDEIGQLQASFSEMVSQLAASRREMEEFNLQLLRRNRELSTLYEISHLVSGRSKLGDILEQGLEKTVGLVAALGGWICLVRADRSCRVIVSLFTDSSDLRHDMSDCCECPMCMRAMNASKPTVIDVSTPGCVLALPRFADRFSGTPYHVAIPLPAGDRIVGMLNLVCDDEACSGEEDLQLLEAIGYQLGAVIDKETLQEDLLRRIIAAQEEERKRISRELHDETGQALTSLLVGLKLIDRAKSLEEVQESTSNMRGLVAQAIDEVRNLALELRPSVLDDMGLVPALTNYVKSCPERFGLDVDFVATGLEGERLPLEVETTLYRLVQEALTNVARHAAAKNVSVLLERRNGVIVLVVEDDGVGFDPTEVKDSARGGAHLGLYGMEERVSLVGGALTVDSRPGAGTAISVEVPVGVRWLRRETELAGPSAF
jgi:signal transduction histidine kinase